MAASGPDVPWRRALALLWVGQVISHLGDSLFLVGIFFLALEVTGSKAQSGLLIALNFLPALALGLFAGAFVDRHDRRQVMFAADLLRGLAVASIPILHEMGRLTPVALGIAMFALATGSTLFTPALKAFIPELVPAGMLTPIAAIFQISEVAALMLGPAIAGLVIIPELGLIHLFTLDAATFLVSTLCVLALAPVARRAAHAAAMRAAEAAASGPTKPRANVWRNVWGDVMQGLRAVLAAPALRWLLVVVALDNLLMTGLAQVATPLLVKESLGLGSDAFARAQTFFFLGMLAASAGFWLFARRAPKGPIILIGIVLDGLTFIPLAFCQTLPQIEAVMFLHAVAVPLMIIPRTVMMQQLVPGPLHGRAFALINVTVFGMSAISAATIGLLAERIEPRALLLTFGIAGTLPGLLGLGVRSLRRVR